MEEHICQQLEKDIDQLAETIGNAFDTYIDEILTKYLVDREKFGKVDLNGKIN